MSAYAIDFSDPLKGGFSIPAGGFNGPGGSSANTSLRLYGRGALEWGEAVDEDLVRLTENFASASAPSFPITGQWWVEQSLYYRNTSIGNVLQGWYYYDINSVAVNKWTLLNGTGVVAGAPSLTPVEGEHYSDGTTLFGYYSLGKYEPATWLARSSISGAGVPVSPTVTPLVTVRVYNGGKARWETPSTTIVSGTTPPSPTAGNLWYNTTTGNLLVYTGSVWQEILGPTGSNLSTASGNLELNSFRITGMANAINPQDATTLAQVTSLVGGAGAGTYLPLTGGTLSGAVTFNGGVIVHNVNSTFTTLTSSGTATLHALSVPTTATITSTLTASAGLVVGTTASVGSTLTVSGALNANGAVNIGGLVTLTSDRITGLATPLLGSDATTKTYVDNAISTATSGLLTAGSVALTNYGGVPKNGDIRTSSPNIVDIYSNGAWRRVFPAQWAA